MKNFKIKEMFVNDSIKNATYDDIDNIISSLEYLQIIRDILHLPIHINSGFRSSEHNALVGGVKNSYHLRGLAADITCDSNSELLGIIKNYIPHDNIAELIPYYDDNHKLRFIHIAFKP